MTGYRAINDTVIVEITKPTRETTTQSGLIVYDSEVVNKTTVIGIITSVGEGKFDHKTGVFVAPPVKVGDKILLSISTGVELDKTHRMLRTDDIFAVLAE